MFHAYWNKCKPAPLDMKEPWRRTSITSPANIMLQCFDGFIGIASKLVQQRDEAATDNGTRSVVAGSLESGTIADAEIDTYDDHRMAMCFSLASLSGHGKQGARIRINDPQCVAKTYPEYFQAFAAITDPVGKTGK